jgi:glycosyltransferase involved in cell wall biosynthesis
VPKLMEIRSREARGAESRGSGRSTARRWIDDRSSREAKAGSIVFHAGGSSFDAIGGGEYQLVQTGRGLEKLGFDVTLWNRPIDRDASDRIKNVRLVHLFGMSRSGLEFARLAERAGVPVVLSPICWVEPRAMTTDQIYLQYLKVKWGLRRIFPKLPAMRRDMLRIADAILPNTNAERDQLVKLFGADRSRTAVVPNGVELRFASADPALFRSIYGEEPFVLFVGRIEPRKNLHRLIKACRKLAAPLVVIGAAPRGRECYEAECRRLAAGRATWLGEIGHDDPLLESAYAAARVTAAPSWFETPGLAALEGGIAGSAVVVTRNGGTSEYFGEHAEYVDPASMKSIESAIGRAFGEGADRALASRIASRFTWEIAVERTREAYERTA